MDVRSWRSRRAKNGTVAALQAESFNLRRARQEDDMCCGQGVERGSASALALCGDALDALKDGQSEAPGARGTRKGKSATHTTSDHQSPKPRKAT